MGREFGATTGRARRCGWFDAVATRYAGMINGIDEIAVTNLDGLDSLATIQVCVAYKLGPQDARGAAERLARSSPSASPIYVEHRRLAERRRTSAKTWSDLPKNAQQYLEKHRRTHRREAAHRQRRPEPRPDDRPLSAD